MQKCKKCGCQDFYKEDGYFYCQTCQTQNEDVREEILELRVDATTRLRKTKIKRSRSDRSGEELGWTSWELYNFILIGMTNELIELGAPSDIKLTVLQLWATYLGRIEVAFTSTKKKCVPKLARRYNKRDAEIIYGKVQAQKRARKRKRTGSSTSTSMVSGYQSEGSSLRELNKNKRLFITSEYDRYIQSQGSSDVLSSFSQSMHSVQSSSVKSSDNETKIQFNSYAKDEINKIKKMSRKIPKHERARYKEKHVSTQYKIGPHIITPMRLWAILYLALRIHDQPIHLGDMLRYGREGHLSYYKLDHLFPPEVTLTKSEISFLSQSVELTHKGMRRIIASMAKFLGVWQLSCPDFLPLVTRYCQELGLPRGILLYTERLIALSPPKMTFDAKKPCIPNYEGRAVAFIIVVLKVLFGLDDITEHQINRVAETINRTPRIIVHGGAGSCNDSITIEKMTACKKAAAMGYTKLINGESSVEAVEAALWWLECDEFFNCGYGSVLNEIGNVEMDASIMNGLTFKCGSVAAVSDIEHPISLAKYVMNHFPNCIFVGDGAKSLAKHANLTWLSDRNMIAPTAYLAFKLAEEGKYEADWNSEIFQYGETLKNSFGTVGCVAYDGCSITAGTTTGGLNRKLVGRVGDSALLGCGTFADRNTGCSLTGHGESIMKLGLSRRIVEDIEQQFSAREALQKNLSYMLNEFGYTGGGIVLQTNGFWATYFTSDKMPYAVIADDLITFGIGLNDKKIETYYDQNLLNSLCNERRSLDFKLFSFQEWQRYIECRKTILVCSHYPTKLKYCPDAHGIDSLYIKFLDFVNSKADREEPEITNQKHFLPEELISAMKNYMIDLSSDDPPPKEIEMFPASLTPLRSYLQQLLSHPLYDLPSAIHTDFFFTKVQYTTNPDVLRELATKCGIKLDIIDSNLHFVEKIVPPFEQPRMPTIEELKQPVEIEDDVDTDEEYVEKSENSYDYIHKKIPCTMLLNAQKERIYNNVWNFARNIKRVNLVNELNFADVLPNGKLAIPSDNESEDDINNADSASNADQKSKLLDSKFCDKYNLHLSQAEKESICRPDKRKLRKKKRRRTQLIRDSKGQFIKGTSTCANIEKSTSEDDLLSENNEFTSENTADVEIIQQSGLDLLHTGNDQSLNIEDMDILFEFVDENEKLNLSEVSFLDNTNIFDPLEENFAIDGIQFFRPFKDYWMYHCIFSRVKPKNFEDFEKALPRSFRWLLNECAHMVEMTTEDLYEEVCLIETYHAHIFKSAYKNDDKANLDSKASYNLTLSKW